MNKGESKCKVLLLKNFAHLASWSIPTLVLSRSGQKVCSQPTNKVSTLSLLFVNRRQRYDFSVRPAKNIRKNYHAPSNSMEMESS